MTKPALDKGSPSLTPHGDVLQTPGGSKGEAGKPDEKGLDVPAKPGQPTPYPTKPDHPGGPPEPVDPGKPPTL